MSNQILILCATRFGATEKTAHLIAEHLTQNGYTCTSKNLKKTNKKQLPDTSQYNHIIIGSGIKMSKWTKEAMNYLEDNSTYIRNNHNNFSVFVSCGTAAEKEKIDQARHPGHIHISRVLPHPGRQGLPKQRALPIIVV